KWSPRGGS
nr:Chain i, PYCO1 SSU binding motif [Phaeodactylum tricornutum]7YK5_j Chain j, PYCO1 SSU binding motif [Phaeodactylum tricornutum]7YK5_k Chain k, PYCO1 SSU binding motif [Phaeodactylum tricornutum]7YK5_l Chain l, PYCO1 SSU binding motif [Phaeodactylum tricornutum]